MTRIHDLNLTDPEYAALAARGYDSHLEYLMMEAGTPPEEARKLVGIVGLVKDKPPEAEEEWEEFINVWEGYLIGELLGVTVLYL